MNMSSNGEMNYDFPYHYLPRYNKGRYKHSRRWEWGYQFLAALELILDELDSMKFQTLLDVGCGDGRLLQEVAEKYPDRILHGIDVSKSGVFMARALNHHSNVRYLLKDITIDDLPQDDYDVITLVETLEHIPPKEADDFLAAIASKVSGGGYFIITVPSKNKEVSQLHFQHFSESELKELLIRHGFSIEKVKFLAKQDYITELILKLFKRIWLYRPGTRIAGWCYDLYKKYFFIGDPTNTGRIYIKAKKQQ